MAKLRAQADDDELARSTLVPLPAHAFARQHFTDVPPRIGYLRGSCRLAAGGTRGTPLLRSSHTSFWSRTLQAGAHPTNPPPLHSFTVQKSVKVLVP